MGVFEGKYLNDCRTEFPADWFRNAALAPQTANAGINFFRLKSRLSLQEWQKRGWIYGPDPRGWFQWYCRYYLGRRLPEIDRIQIRRWKSFKRHKIQIEKTAGPAIWDAVPVNVRHCCNGPITLLSKRNS